MNAASDPLALYGTEEPPPERRRLTAGPLGAVLEDGNLRTICFDGVEVVRAVSYLARDGSWGTYRAGLADLTVEQREQDFTVSYRGLCAGPEGRYAYRMTIHGAASGSLVLTAEGEALSDFPTNRTGFVVLHPSGAAGGELEIRHGDGTIERTRFPRFISADQPAFDIAALTHRPAPGLRCTVEMEGDAFEMEDQRNWTDASFKTYVRSLSKPRPYVIARGEKDIQRIAITVRRTAPAAAAPERETAATVTIGRPAGTMPRVALFLDDQAPFPSEMPGLPAQDLIARFDPADRASRGRLRPAADLAGKMGAGLTVEGIFDCRDPAAEARALVDGLNRAGASPSAIMVSPRRDFRTRPSGTLPSGERPADDVVAALRGVGFEGRIGSGTPSFFTEFNRNPPGPVADFVFFSIAGNVHAADDLSIMETLSVYPAILDSARRLCPGKPIRLGPCTIGMRHNPYGADVASNPARGRKAGARLDPRQGAQFGAAFMAGVVANSFDVETLTMAAVSGAFGLLDDDGETRACAGIHSTLARAAGRRRFAVECSGPSIAAVAFDGSGEGLCSVVANLGGDRVSVAHSGTPAFTLGPYQTIVVDGLPRPDRA